MKEFAFIIDQSWLDSAPCNPKTEMNDEWEKWCNNSETWLRSCGLELGTETVYVTAPNRTIAKRRLEKILPFDAELLNETREFFLDEELHALRAYAQAHGKIWKRKLAADWVRGRASGVLEAYARVLLKLRNDREFGPRGLAEFRFPKP